MTRGRDPATGRWQPGTSGDPAGRPAGVDFRRAIADHVAASGEDLEAVVAVILERLRTIARGKDSAAVAACRELLGRICGPLPVKVGAEDEDVAGLQLSDLEPRPARGSGARRR